MVDFAWSHDLKRRIWRTRSTEFALLLTVADNREQYYSLTFTCSGCGWKVNLHRTNPPHFEHHASNPKLCVLPH